MMHITVASFDYDALGHRVRKIDAIAGQATLYYNGSFFGFPIRETRVQSKRLN